MTYQIETWDNIALPAGRSAEIVPFPANENSRLKILHIALSPRIAGSERYCIDLANAQAALGHEVHVAGRSGSPLAAALADGVTFHSLGPRLFWRVMLRRLVKTARIDICHAHLSPACKALRDIPNTVRKIATLHVGYKSRQHGRLDGLVCVNQIQATRLGGYQGQTRVISNWMPSQSDAARPMDIRAELGLDAGTMLVGGVGRLHPSKGFDLLISAFRNSAPENAALVILGEGRQRADLEKLSAADPRIHLLGFRENVPGFLANLDLFVSPSREESFGLAILEAMSAGLPIISTETEGPAEYLRTQPLDLVPVGSPLALTKAMARHFATGFGPVSYDLSAFQQSTGVAEILDFYNQLGPAVERRRATAATPAMLDYA